MERMECLTENGRCQAVRDDVIFVFYHVQLDVWMCDGRTGNGDNAAGCRFHNILPGCCGPTAAGIAMYSALRLLVSSIFIHTIIIIQQRGGAITAPHLRSPHEPSPRSRPKSIFLGARGVYLSIVSSNRVCTSNSLLCVALAIPSIIEYSTSAPASSLPSTTTTTTPHATTVTDSAHDTVRLLCSAIFNTFDTRHSTYISTEAPPSPVSVFRLLLLP